MANPIERARNVYRAIDEMVSDLRADSVRNVATGLGGARDKGSRVAVDTSRIPMTSYEKDALGRYDGYIAKWLSRLANEATLKGWDIKADAANIQEFNGLDKRYGLTGIARRALQTATNDGGALILLVTADQGGTKMDRPLNLNAVKRLRAIHVFDPSEFEPLEYETNWRDQNFRKPRFWQVSPGVAGVATNLTRLMKVHHSRCIYVPGRGLSDRLRLENGGHDDSWLESVWDALKDMRQVDQGGAVLAQEMVQTVIKMAGLENIESGGLRDAMHDKLKAIVAGKGLLGAVLLNIEDEYQSHAAHTTGYKDLNAGAQETWAAATGQPQVVAFGATPGGLNTDGEAGRRSQDREVGTFQETHLRPLLERIYTVIAAAEGLTSEWRLVFRPLGTLTPVEEAEVREKNARTDRIYRQEGILTPEHIRESRFGPDGYGDIRPFSMGGSAGADPNRAMSGPQMRSALEIVQQAALKQIPRDAGISMLVTTLNIDATAAEGMMGEAGLGFKPEPLVPPELPKPPGEAPDVGDAPDNQGVEAN